MKTIYRCRECGEDYKAGSPVAKESNIGTVDQLIYHLDPCTCLDDKEGYALDKLHDAEVEIINLKKSNEDKQQHIEISERSNNSLTAKIHNIKHEIKRLRAELENIIDSAGCCTGEDAQNMLDIAQWALKGGTPDAKE
jgi:hypothetical protein